MTVTALASAEPPPEPMNIADWLRSETGHQHPRWCGTHHDGTECTAAFRAGPIAGQALLPTGAHEPTVTLSDGRGQVVVPVGVVRDLAQRLLLLSSDIPHPWLRKQP